MGQTRRLYYRLEVAIDAVAVRSPRNRASPTGTLPEAGGPVPVEDPSSPAPEPSPLGNGWAPLDHARVIDISGSGVHLQAQSADLAIGDRVVLAFPFGGQDYRVATEAMWVRRSRLGSAVRAGLRFEGMEQTERDALVREIYRVQRGAARQRRR